MLGFFPTPYPDELLYSIVARLQIRLGARSSRALMNELFGRQGALAVTDVPGHLSHFSEALPLGVEYSPLRLVVEHSHLPYYAPFLPSGRTDRVCQLMASGSVLAVKHGIGLLASTFRSNRYFRVCPACVQSDLDTLGESYWRRLHQLLGVEICPDHRLFLQETPVPATNRMDRSAFLAVPSHAAGLPRVPFEAGNPEHADLLNLAIDIRWLLANGMDTVGRLGGLHQRYHAYLAKQGLASQQGRVHVGKVQETFLHRYSKGFLDRVQAPLDVDSRSNWLCRLLWDRTRAHHPVRHLLVIHWLGVSLPEFLVEEPMGPFGVGPWPCLNPACGWFHQPIIAECKVIRDKRTRQTRGTFSCTCGFSYTRWGPDPDGAWLFAKTRVRTFGPVWVEKVEGLLRAGEGVKRIARIMNVDCKTVNKHRDVQKLSSAHNSASKRSSEDTRAIHRSTWMEVRKGYPTAGRSELRKLVPRSYDWLVRQDRPWYELNSPPVERSRPRSQRVNWAERDMAWARAIREVAASGTNAPGRQLSKRALACRIGCHGLLEYRLDRLPLTTAALEDLIGATRKRTAAEEQR